MSDVIKVGSKIINCDWVNHQACRLLHHILSYCQIIIVNMHDIFQLLFPFYITCLHVMIEQPCHIISSDKAITVRHNCIFFSYHFCLLFCYGHISLIKRFIFCTYFIIPLAKCSFWGTYCFQHVRHSVLLSTF